MKLQYLKFPIGGRGPVTLIPFEKHELTLREIYMIIFSKGEIRYCPDFIFKVQLKHYISRFTYCINLNIFSDYTHELSHS